MNDTPTPEPEASLDPVADAGQLLHRARDSKTPRTRKLAERVLRDLTRLGRIVAAEVEVARANAILDRARAAHKDAWATDDDAGEAAPDE